jgi:type VI secretion system secreted protein Hcp
VAIYMHFQGIDGSVSAAGHEKWIELDGASVGVSRMVTSSPGRGDFREASTPEVSEVSVTKAVDAASVGLFKASLWGEGKKVKIDFCKTDKDAIETYIRLELENAVVSSYNFGGANSAEEPDARPSESLSLNFTKITYNVTAMDVANKTEKTARASWDVAALRGS